jgi:hypothetical protein
MTCYGLPVSALRSELGNCAPILGNCAYIETKRASIQSVERLYLARHSQGECKDHHRHRGCRSAPARFAMKVRLQAQTDGVLLLATIFLLMNVMIAGTAIFGSFLPQPPCRQRYVVVGLTARHLGSHNVRTREPASPAEIRASRLRASQAR